MAHALVTGCAGFIGSTLCEALVARGWQVSGVDAFTETYDQELKWRNLAALCADPDHRFALTVGELEALEPGWLDKLSARGPITHVFHLAGQPGVRQSWGTDFPLYTRRNIDATQRLLEACVRLPGLRAFVFASTSSVYGDRTGPQMESAPCEPIAPYGVTKLAMERLCQAYWRTRGVPAIGVRYFTVYGPRQRPDMAFHRWIRAALDGAPVQVFGDGQQTRDFTFVTDAVRATIAAAEQGRPGSVYNVAGGAPTSVTAVLGMLREIHGHPLRIACGDQVPGDVRHTHGDAMRAWLELGAMPAVSLREGLQKQYDWQRGT